MERFQTLEIRIQSGIHGGSVSLSGSVLVKNIGNDGSDSTYSSAISNLSGTVTMSNGTVFSEKANGIYNYSGATLTITGGTISSTANNKISCGVDNKGTCYINGGSITSTNTHAVNNDSGATLTVTAGTIKTLASDKYGVYNAGTANITGGDISSKYGC